MSRRGRLERLERLAAFAFVAVMLAFIYLPVATLTLFSFHAGKVPVPPFEGPTLAWYAEVLGSARLRAATASSLLVGAGAALVATMLAAAAAIGLARSRLPGAPAIRAVLVLPVAVSSLVVGLGLLVMLAALGIGKSLLAVGIGHVVLVLPVAFAVLTGALTPAHIRLEQAARDLGAGERQVLLRVTLPSMRPALIAALALAFTFSWDEFIVAFLLGGFQPTLPVQIASMLRTGLDPATNAAGTLVFLVSLVGALTVELLLRSRRRGATGP